jgi:hypothetical protein
LPGDEEAPCSVGGDVHGVTLCDRG